MKKFIITATSTLACLISTLSLAIPPKPVKCPTVTSLQDSHFNLTQQQGDGNWMVIDAQDKFDTDDSWTFFVFDIEAQTTAEAYVLAKKKVKDLTFIQGPILYPEKERWACIYTASEDDYAVAYTPVINF